MTSPKDLMCQSLTFEWNGQEWISISIGPDANPDDETVPMEKGKDQGEFCYVHSPKPKPKPIGKALHDVQANETVTVAIEPYPLKPQKQQPFSGATERELIIDEDEL